MRFVDLFNAISSGVAASQAESSDALSLVWRGQPFVRIAPQSMSSTHTISLVWRGQPFIARQS